MSIHTMLEHLLKKEDFIEGRFIPKDLFVFVGYRVHQLLTDDTAILDSNMYALIYVSSFDEEIKNAECY